MNIRLTRREYDVVRALVFLAEGGSSASDVLRDVVEVHLAEEREDEDVQTALRALETRRARRAGTLKSLRTRSGGSA